MELPDARAAHRRDLSSEKATTVCEDLNLLTQLLKPIDANQADAVARRLITEFGSMAHALAETGSGRFLTVCQSQESAHFLGIVRQSMLHGLRSEINSGPIIDTSAVLTTYLQVLLANETGERFYVLFLDASNRLIREEVVGIGTISSVLVHPRTIVHRALDLRAAAMILVHNHPSGNVAPSDQDLAFTKRICALAKGLDLRVHDHVIVGHSGCASFRNLGLL